MKRPAAFFLSLLVFAVAALIGAPAQAQEPASPEPPRLRLDLNQLNPRVITAASTTLTVSGTVTNIGDRRITKPQVRLQVGDRLTGDRELKGVLAGNLIQDSPLTDFTTLTESLEPGQTAKLDVTVPLDGKSALQLSRPGVYPMLVNVNGTPEFGGPARLAAVSLLMPVLSGPGHSAPPGKHADVSVLWPITDSAPHVLSSPYGGQLTLTDDSLAAELSPNGRLHSLVAAARAVQQSDPSVGNSLCFAIDPDLLRTVDAMTHGYVVAGAPGKGGPIADDWLRTLRTLVNGHCVIALPYADADLTTLGKVRSANGTPDAGLMTTALSGEATISQVLQTQPRQGVLWPDGTPDDQALSAMSAAGVQTVLTDGSKLQADSPVTSAVSLPGGLRAQPIDGVIASAMVGSAPNPQNPTTVSAATQPAIASQNGLAAIAFEAGLGRASTGSSAKLLVAPPRRWDVPVNELTGFLQHLGQLVGPGGVATSAPLSELLEQDAQGTASFAAGTHDQPISAGADVTDTLSDLDGQAAGLLSAMRVDTIHRVQPDAVVAPVRNALVRGASTAFRAPSGATAGANADAELAAIRDQVTVEQPRQTIALASGSSPLPVAVSNGLPVGITAQIALKNEVGIRPEQVQNWFFPAKGGTNELVQIEALRAGRLSVDVSLTTPAGTQLGTTARFELTSTEYGPITIIITVVAGCALLLLASRRIYRRVKEGRAARAESR
ncbi:DUF6049 family protein [Amycolatopsis rhabdoformis]|uniref:DUF6049 family protein n=1 Tax=Amycolatopsis rhabdoformis TaxID=1448059 RepID=A0ABZ1I4B7_9PSEU|nr:DUF6049 family protein [Amycolatopsis rhabdoformis]WSE28358.1 DUF6049 family protein [Amycolatopsis rhabdoformis]